MQDVHEVEQVFGLAASDVVDLIRRYGQAVVARHTLGGFLHDTDDALHDVVDVGEVAAAGFEDVVEAHDVALDVGVWVLDAVAHTRLGRKVDHAVFHVIIAHIRPARQAHAHLEEALAHAVDIGHTLVRCLTNFSKDSKPLPHFFGLCALPSSLHHSRRHPHRRAMPQYGFGDHGFGTDGGIFADGGLGDDFHACATVNTFLDKHLTRNVARWHECRVILDYGVVIKGFVKPQKTDPMEVGSVGNQ